MLLFVRGARVRVDDPDQVLMSFYFFMLIRFAIASSLSESSFTVISLSIGQAIQNASVGSQLQVDRFQ
jgi:hypothetical protein